MVFAETDRLILRPLQKQELPRLTALLGSWDVAQWLAVLPYPYTTKDAEEFFAEEDALLKAGKDPEFFAIALKPGNILIGGISLHAPRGRISNKGDVEIGYWLGTSYWGRGYMTEAARAVVAIAMSRTETQTLVATTVPMNLASQKVLLKIGMENLGLTQRDYATLRGGDEIARWQLTRSAWECRAVLSPLSS